jgi:hypothetical protein
MLNSNGAASALEIKTDDASSVQVVEIHNDGSESEIELFDGDEKQGDEDGSGELPKIPSYVSHRDQASPIERKKPLMIGVCWLSFFLPGNVAIFDMADIYMKFGVFDMANKHSEAAGRKGNAIKFLTKLMKGNFVRDEYNKSTSNSEVYIDVVSILMHAYPPTLIATLVEWINGCVDILWASLISRIRRSESDNRELFEKIIKIARAACSFPGVVTHSAIMAFFPLLWLVRFYKLWIYKTQIKSSIVGVMPLVWQTLSLVAFITLAVSSLLPEEQAPWLYKAEDAFFDHGLDFPLLFYFSLFLTNFTLAPLELLFGDLSEHHDTLFRIMYFGGVFNLAFVILSSPLIYEMLSYFLHNIFCRGREHSSIFSAGDMGNMTSGIEQGNLHELTLVRSKMMGLFNSSMTHVKFDLWSLGEKVKSTGNSVVSSIANCAGSFFSACLKTSAEDGNGFAQTMSDATRSPVAAARRKRTGTSDATTATSSGTTPDSETPMTSPPRSRAGTR